MTERKPREFEIEACPGCGCDPEACVCDECDEIETVPVVEVLGPERMLAWAIDRLGEDAVAERLVGERRVLELWMCPECGDATVRTSLDSPWRRPCEGRVVVSRFERHAPTPPERVRALVLDAAALEAGTRELKDEPAPDAVDPLRDRARVVPIIQQATEAHIGFGSRVLAEAVFDALTGSDET